MAIRAWGRPQRRGRRRHVPAAARRGRRPPVPAGDAAAAGGQAPGHVFGIGEVWQGACPASEGEGLLETRQKPSASKEVLKDHGFSIVD